MRTQLDRDIDERFLAIAREASKYEDSGEVDPAPYVKDAFMGLVRRGGESEGRRDLFVGVRNRLLAELQSLGPNSTHAIRAFYEDVLSEVRKISG